MGILQSDTTTFRKLSSLRKSLLEKILVCKGNADKLAMRDPRNAKEYYIRVVDYRIEKIVKRRYGVDYWLKITN